MKVTLPTPADTYAFGVRLATVLRAGDVLILTGPIGAGKTALTKGIGAGLGVRGQITSPTFVIARVHPPLAEGAVSLVHVDAYRLGSVAEVDDLDLDADLASAVTVVEWGEGLAENLTDAYLLVTVDRARVMVEERDDGSESRTVTLMGVGGDWEQRLTAIASI